ncbi:arabinanase [Panus rudis PR-1116 ss-1]|nr:arabinanase [Panus rudis PR-1116 ss-1]
MKFSVISTVLFAFATVGLAVPGPIAVTGDTVVHDPSICKDGSGKYFLFSSGLVGEAGMTIRTSTDRVNWVKVGNVFPNGAPWTDQFTGRANAPLWAPDCTFVNGRFYVLLCYGRLTHRYHKSGIFLATSTTGLPGSWTNQGLVTSTSDPSSNYNVGPSPELFLRMVVDGGNWYLDFGSFWTGIKLLNPSTGKPSSNSLTSLATRTVDNGAEEAPIIHKNGNFYYLFTSWDHCCQGTSSNYNIRVGRSSSVDGPYVDRDGVAMTAGGGTLVLESHDSIHGPGGQSIFNDNDGTILVYHYYTANGSFLGLNRLDFSSGWPVVV